MNPQQAATATLDEHRDWLAGDDGYKREPAFMDDVTGVVLPERWYKHGRSHPDGHPYPATLDGAAKAMPEGWEWWKDATDWIAQAPHSDFVYVRNTGDEIADRYRLGVLCRIAEKEAKG